MGRFQPQTHLCEFDREFVPIDAVNATTHNGPLDLNSIHLSQLGEAGVVPVFKNCRSKVVKDRDKEMARTQRRVAYPEGVNRSLKSIRVLLAYLTPDPLENRIQRVGG